MSIKSTLRKEGIEVIQPIDTLRKNSISNKISNTLCSAFPEHGFSFDNLFMQISSLNMYIANFSDITIGAKYFYKTKSIYFNVKFDLDELNMFALHECIHYLQENYDYYGGLSSYGLHNVSQNCGRGINEAAVQIMTCEALGKQVEDVKYYNLNLKTISPTYYPLECAILRQICYFTGTFPLYHSALFSDDIFKNTFIALSDNKTFQKIQENLDKMLVLENELAFCTSMLEHYEDNIGKVRKLNTLIDKYKQEISQLFLKTQNRIIAYCFSKEFYEIKTLEEASEFQKNLYEFRNYIAYNDFYTFYNEFYCKAMEKLEEKKSEIINTESLLLSNDLSKDITVVSNVKGAFSFFKRIIYRLGLSRRKEML